MCGGLRRAEQPIICEVDIKYVSMMFQVLLFLMVAALCAFADLASFPEDRFPEPNDDEACAAYPLDASSQMNVFTALIVLLAVAGTSSLAYRALKKTKEEG